MGLLTRPLGRRPVGLWIALVLVLTVGLLFWVGQVLSLTSWDTAVAVGLQEDSPTSDSVVDRTMVAVSWGEAGADVPVMGALIVLIVVGIVRRRPFGFVAGVSLGILWIYVTPMILLQRGGLYTGGLEPDLARRAHVGPPMVLGGAVPGLILLVCMVANRRFFHSGADAA